LFFFEEEEINHSPGEVKLLKITSEKVKIIDNSLLESWCCLFEISSKFKQYSSTETNFSLLNSNTDEILNLQINKFIEFIEAPLEKK
jgi:hypothetical protein